MIPAKDVSCICIYGSLQASKQTHLLVGYVMCLESACNMTTVDLTPNTDLPDGGKEFGVGSLAAYVVRQGCFN